MNEWMEQILEHLPDGMKAKIGATKAVLAIWDSLSDSAKLEIANATVDKLRKMESDQEAGKQ